MANSFLKQNAKNLRSNQTDVEHIISTSSPEFAKRKSYRNNSPYQEVWNALDKVYDPELPGLTIWDLGILQDVQLVNDIWKISITPTYSGCPAVDTICQDIKIELAKHNYHQVEIDLVLSPAWSTEMISPNGKAQLKSINIAPPNRDDKVCCPICDSQNTNVISQFGSTACKSLYQCKDCLETFDYFKRF